MKLSELQQTLKLHPRSLPRFVLPDGDYIPLHAHLTEVGHVIRTFIDCGGLTGREEKIVLQAHVGEDTDHQLRSDRFAKILGLGERVVPNTDLDVDVEYDCCVVAQYPINEVRPRGQYLDLVLGRGRTQCRARERRETQVVDACCSPDAACC
ncbi:MAG TPA: DUF6428 family protein [Chthoniobacterales bacterium]|nr:DUF6428 family protein [Chthoniobacterales bacterium]